MVFVDFGLRILDCGFPEGWEDLARGFGWMGGQASRQTKLVRVERP
jgi:hypothetical protein